MSPILERRRGLLVTALAALSSAGLLAGAPHAEAAVTSASIAATTATLNLDGADDIVNVTVSGGNFVHGQTTGGLNSGSDWDSTVAGDQTVPANDTFSIVVNGGAGNDDLKVLALNPEIVKATVNGEAGDDTLTGADSNDDLTGDDGNDRLVGAKGADNMAGGNNNDTLVWNNGDGSDTINGDAGNDATEFNGAAVQGDTLTMQTPVVGRVEFKRTNLVNITLDTSTERFQVNGLGGDDSLTVNNGVGALTLLAFNGGAGNDTVNGSEGADFIQGDEGNDTLNGGGGDDRIVGDRGNDTVNGGAGDDTLVWNNGDGTDVMNGDDGRDDVEVNGAVAQGDIFTVQPNGARVKFDRTNLVPFSLDIGTSESMHANGLGGDDSVTVGEVGAFAVTANGGAGNDTLTGGGSTETFLGGTGNDVVNPGAGIDAVQGDDGDDTVNVRDDTADVARGGDGNDSVVADTAALDILDGFESVDRTQVVVVTPPANPGTPDTNTRPVAITGGTIKVK